MKIYETLLKEKIRVFLNSFLEVSRELYYDDKSGSFVHPGEFGTYREDTVKSFIRFFIPQRLSIDTGFVINYDGDVSYQCDLVVFDRDATPLIENTNKQRFFPVETVCAVGEVKSTLTYSKFQETLLKLTKVKRMRDKILHPIYIHNYKPFDSNQQKFAPEREPFDQIFTFLVCESLEFDIEDKLDSIFDLYSKHLPSIPVCHRHNIILNIRDGIFYYH